MRRYLWVRPANLTLVVMLALVLGALATAVTAGAPIQQATGPDLIMVKQVILPRPFSPGDPITFTLTITNQGNIDALGVVVTDVIPSEVVATSFGSTMLVTPTGATSYVWDVAPLRAGFSGVIAIYGTIDPGIPASSTITNEAVVYDPLDTDTANNTSSVTIRQYPVFLPMVLRGPSGPPPVTPTPVSALYGHVALDGGPAVSKTMQLRFIAGSYKYFSATTTTDLNGNYAFTGMPGLEIGQRYVGLYPGTDGASYLRYWWTRSITMYTSGESVNMGSADLADIHLLHPDGGSDTLPVTFQWTPRPATPSDSYSLHLEGQLGDSQWDGPTLGYTGTYTLSSLPPGFYVHGYYRWSVRVNAPDGGNGESRYGNLVWFSNSGSAALGSEPLIPVGWREEDPR